MNRKIERGLFIAVPYLFTIGIINFQLYYAGWITNFLSFVFLNILILITTGPLVLFAFGLGFAQETLKEKRKISVDAYGLVVGGKKRIPFSAITKITHLWRPYSRLLINEDRSDNPKEQVLLISYLDQTNAKQTVELFLDEDDNLSVTKQLISKLRNVCDQTVIDVIENPNAV